MSHDSALAVSSPERGLLALAARLAPDSDRARWRAGREAELAALRTLIARGEVVRGQAQITGFYLDAFLSAFCLRWTPAALRKWTRGPKFVIAAAAAALLLIAVASHGLATTRLLIRVAQGYQPPPANIGHALLFAYLTPIGVALATGLMLIFIGHIRVARRSWSYRGLLIGKACVMFTIASLVWIEGGHALRIMIPGKTSSVLVGGIIPALAYICACGCGTVWNLADQRRRCPVCLRLLEMPVTLGSWASVFDPPTTEMICTEGHGVLNVLEAEPPEADRWVTLDASWRALFKAKPDQRRESTVSS